MKSRICLTFKSHTFRQFGQVISALLFRITISRFPIFLLMPQSVLHLPGATVCIYPPIRIPSTQIIPSSPSPEHKKTTSSTADSSKCVAFSVFYDIMDIEKTTVHKVVGLVFRLESHPTLVQSTWVVFLCFKS